jgi:sialic acid synthase SpsE
MKSLEIGDKKIGDGHPCFIIAEAGVNHNGDLEVAKRLVDAAIEAGADAVKFQTFKAGELGTEVLATMRACNPARKEWDILSFWILTRSSQAAGWRNPRPRGRRSVPQ